MKEILDEQASLDEFLLVLTASMTYAVFGPIVYSGVIQRPKDFFPPSCWIVKKMCLSRMYYWIFIKYVQFQELGYNVTFTFLKAHCVCVSA